MKPSPLLWPAMRATQGDPERFGAWLADLDGDQMILLAGRIRAATEALESDPRFEAGIEPEERRRLAQSVVARGEQAWLDARRHPDAVRPDAGLGATDLLQAIEGAYEGRFDRPMPLQEPDPRGRSDLVATPEWEDTAWKLVDVLNGGLPAAAMLERFTRCEIVRLINTLESLSSRTLDDRHRAIIAPDAGDFAEDDIAMWVVDRGRDVWEQVRRDPSLLPTRLPEDGHRPWVLVLNDVYSDRYGEDAPAPP